jgi:hypothetical protein
MAHIDAAASDLGKGRVFIHSYLLTAGFAGEVGVGEVESRSASGVGQTGVGELLACRVGASTPGGPDAGARSEGPETEGGAPGGVERTLDAGRTLEWGSHQSLAALRREDSLLSPRKRPPGAGGWVGE